MITFKTITAQNFMSFKELSLNLADQGIVSIEGVNKTNGSFVSNGSGKSNLLESFVWSIWGETIRPLKSVEDVVNEKIGKDCHAFITFTDNDGVNWEIRRYRAHHEFKNKVLLFREGEEWTKDVKIQDKVNSILGIDFKSFKSAFIFYNDGTKPFSACTDSEQKKLLEKLFDLEKYSSLLEITKNKLKNINQQYSDLITKISQDKIKLDSQTKEITNLENLERIFTKDIESKVQKFDLDISVLEKMDNAANIFVLSQEIDNLKRELECLGQTDLSTAGLAEQLEALRKELSVVGLIEIQDISPTQEKLNFYSQLSGENNTKIYSKSRDIEDLKKMKTKYEQGIGLQYPVFDVDYALSIKMTQARIKELCDKKTKFEKGLGVECPNCNQEITSEYKQKHIDEISVLIETNGEDLIILTQDKEKNESQFREDNLKLVNESLETAAVELAELTKLKAEADQKWNESKEGLRLIEVKRKEKQDKELFLRTKIDKQASLIDSKKNEKRKKEEIITKQIGVNKDKLSSIEKEQSNNKLKIELLQKQKEQTKQTVNPYSGMIDQKSEQVCELCDLIEMENKEEKDLSNKIKHYQFFETAFSRSGIQSYLLDNIVPILNKYAKHYSNLLSGGSLDIEFCNQLTNKAGEVKEKFGVVVKNRDGSKSYEGDSSGERRRVDLIALFALQKAAMLRSKSRLNLLIIDEAMDALDQAGIENVVHVLEDEISSFPSIFLISHNPEVSGLLDSTITVYKEQDGFSYLK